MSIGFSLHASASRSFLAAIIVSTSTERICNVKSPKESIEVWDKLTKGGWNPGKNKQWTPKLYKNIACCPEDSEFPSELTSISLFEKVEVHSWIAMPQ